MSALRDKERHESGEYVPPPTENSALIAVMTSDGTVCYKSPSSKHLLGYTPEEMVGTNIFAYVHPDDQTAMRNALSQTLQLPGVAHNVEFRFRHQDGSWRMLHGTRTGFLDGAQAPSVILHVQDHSGSKTQQSLILPHELQDALTKLPNRTLFFDLLQQALAAAQKRQRSFALLLVDLDHFREINGTFNHRWGDLLLQQVATRFRHTLRRSDTIARLGGDEFAILLSTTSTLKNAKRAARRILDALEQPFVLEGHAVYVGASIGIALYPEHGTDADTLIRRADVAMYIAKRTGSGYTPYEAKRDQYSPDRLALMGELRHAVEHDQLVLYYQPKANLATGNVTHVEALVRWQHPRHGLLLPDQFIPFAEQGGLIKPLSLWVLNDALRQCRTWHEAGLRVCIAVNLSMRNLQDPQLPDIVARLLGMWGIAPTWLEVEVTESAIAADPDRALATLTHLGTMGVGISIDDFGTGYSSLVHLKQLPVDEIKIDKSFVLGMVSDDNDAAIVRSTIDLGHNLGLKVVAEGVENKEIWDLLVALRCDLAQGYYLSRPIPATELQGWLKKFPWQAGRRTVIPIRPSLTAATRR